MYGHGCAPKGSPLGGPCPYEFSAPLRVNSFFQHNSPFFAAMNAAQAWIPALSSASFHERDWLLSHGSLTRLVQRHCSDFRVKPVFQALALPCGDELAVLDLRCGELALVREVYLYCGDTPVVFAHSVVARKNLRGAWRGLSGLGNRSLGAALFANPKVKRMPFQFKKLNSLHPLFRRACRGLQAAPSAPSCLWARRSLFSLNGKSILVTEVFLPAILELSV